MANHLIRGNNWELLNQLQNDMANFFDIQRSNPWSSSIDSSKIATGQWAPLVDIREEPHQFVILADLPGVKTEDIEITMEAGVLTIKGSRESESRVAADTYSRVERISGNFYRRFSLPDTADSENIKAESTNGVLTITVPKKEKAQARKIVVKSVEKDRHK